MTNNTSQICIDANLVIYSLVPGKLSEVAIDLLEKWQRDNVKLIAPILLAYEVTSTLRRLVNTKMIMPAHGDEAFAQFQRLNIRYVSRPGIISQAWALAKEFDRPEAYDTAYLAVAQIEECEFWTADRKLYHAVGDQLKWVRLVGR